MRDVLIVHSAASSAGAAELLVRLRAAGLVVEPVVASEGSNSLDSLISASRHLLVLLGSDGELPALRWAWQIGLGQSIMRTGRKRLPFRMTVVLCPGIEDRVAQETLDAEDAVDLRDWNPQRIAGLVASLGGSLTRQLDWSSVTPEAFERLMFALISQAPGYENPEWLMRTDAADRGRDLSVTRVVQDALSGVIRNRVIVQCKHWTDRSIGPSDVAQLKEQMNHWEPPRVDVLIIATTGRFSSDAVSLIEKHNRADRALRIEMWPDSHLERLLGDRPALITEFRLR